ncbi:MAG: DUF2235 domain-containing protein [Pusillimonas sp.]
MQLPFTASPAFSARPTPGGPARPLMHLNGRGLKLCSVLLAGLALLWAGSPYSRANSTCMAPNAAAPCRTPASLNQNSPEPQINLGAGNPVHLATGNKYQYETDLLPSASWPLLAITRHYSAQNRRDSFMGQGWHSDFDMRVRQRGPHTVIEQADGSIVTFRVIGPGLHAASANGQLHARAGGGWRWLRGNRQQLDFNHQGWLVGVRGPAGHALAIERHATAGPLHGSIKAVVAHAADYRQRPHRNGSAPRANPERPPRPGPATLVFSYTLQSGRAYLEHIDSPAGRFTYRYEAAADGHQRLAGMQRPDGSQRRYLYEPARQGGNAYALTGIENIGAPPGGTRWRQGQWAYNAANQVVAFGHGAAAYQVRYGLPEAGTGQTADTTLASMQTPATTPPAPARPTASSRTRLQRSDGAITDIVMAHYPAGTRVTSVTGAACPGCPAPGTRATYDTSGRLESVNGTRLGRDPHGRLQRLHLAHTGWAGLQLDYNPLGQRHAWFSRLTGREHATFNPRGLIEQRRFADGLVWHYGYDDAGRPVHLRQGDINTRLRWRGNLLVSVQHPSETEHRDYDAHGRMIRRTLIRPHPDPPAHGEVPLSGTVVATRLRTALPPFTETFTYDNQHRLIRHTLAEGGALHYTWGHRHQMLGLVWENAAGQRHTVFDSRPGQAGYRYGNGLQLTTIARGRDLWLVLDKATPEATRAHHTGARGHDRPVATTTTAHAQRYQFDASGRVAAEQHFEPEAGFWHRDYRHNRQGQLIGAITHSPGQATYAHWYAHDHDGAALTPHAAGITRTESGLPQQVNERRLDYGTDRRLKAVRAGDTLLARYRHNAFGHRIWRQTGGEQTHYWYLDRRLVAESVVPAGPGTRQGQVSRRYLYAHHVPVGLIEYGNETAPGGTLHFVHADLTGTPHEITDTHGHTVWTARYSPWGQAQTRGITFNLRSPGQYHDPATGWHDNLLRTYDPGRGQFLEPDPLGPIPGNQSLGYASQQPRRFIDPTGLLLFAFDGTRNDASTQTNIWKLSQRYHDGPVAYEGGPGNPYTTDWDAITAYSAPRILEAQWQALLDTLAATPADPTQAVPIDIIGYSRGAALARHFGNQVSQHLSNGQFSYHDQQRGLVTACVDLRFMGVFDTVAQFGLNGSGNSAYDLTVDAGWQWVAHAVALHERRWLFPLTSAADTQAGNVVEAAFVGAHADIGGGVFFDGEGQASQRGDLSDVSLNWMLWQARAAGVAFGDGSTDDAVVSAPYLHDDRNSTLRALQNGDRGVDRANGQLWHNYQDDTPRLGRTTREATETFIQRYDDWRRLPGNEVGTVDMQAYSQWLEQTLGTTVAGDSRYH